tara:strand:- start:2847 stop:3326 length:480 start_codon:yes stop_codon:yes gene_type:complete
MKRILAYLNPIYQIKTIILTIKEIYLFISYVKTINSMEKTFKSNGIMKDSKYTLVKGINLKAETLMYGGAGEELERFEISFIGKEMSKYNDIFLENRILELIKTKANRIKNEDFYGYLVSISFNYKYFTLYSILSSILYVILIVLLFLNIPYGYIISNI